MGHKCFEPKITTLNEELKCLLHKYSRQSFSGTPDFILAEYMMHTLSAFESATRARETWYNSK